MVFVGWAMFWTAEPRRLFPSRDHLQLRLGAYLKLHYQRRHVNWDVLCASVCMRVTLDSVSSINQSIISLLICSVSPISLDVSICRNINSAVLLRAFLESSEELNAFLSSGAFYLNFASRFSVWSHRMIITYTAHKAVTSLSKTQVILLWNTFFVFATHHRSRSFHMFGIPLLWVGGQKQIFTTVDRAHSPLLWKSHSRHVKFLSLGQTHTHTHFGGKNIICWGELINLERPRFPSMLLSEGDDQLYSVILI